MIEIISVKCPVLNSYHYKEYNSIPSFEAVIKYIHMSPNDSLDAIMCNGFDENSKLCNFSARKTDNLLQKCIYSKWKSF